MLGHWAAHLSDPYFRTCASSTCQASCNCPWFTVARVRLRDLLESHLWISITLSYRLCTSVSSFNMIEEIPAHTSRRIVAGGFLPTSTWRSAHKRARLWRLLISCSREVTIGQNPRRSFAADQIAEKLNEGKKVEQSGGCGWKQDCFVSSGCQRT
jgi:hypothetical protein